MCRVVVPPNIFALDLTLNRVSSASRLEIVGRDGGSRGTYTVVEASSPVCMERLLPTKEIG